MDINVHRWFVFVVFVVFGRILALHNQRTGATALLTGDFESSADERRINRSTGCCVLNVSARHG